MHGVVEVHLEHRAALLVHQEQHAVLVAEVQCRPFGARVSECPRVDVISAAIPTLSISLSVNNAGNIANNDIHTAHNHSTKYKIKWSSLRDDVINVAFDASDVRRVVTVVLEPDHVRTFCVRVV